jgi:hypothetical protein
MSKGLGIQLAKARKEIREMKLREAGLLKAIQIVSDSVHEGEVGENLFRWVHRHWKTYNDEDHTEEMKEWMI